MDLKLDGSPSSKKSSTRGNKRTSSSLKPVKEEDHRNEGDHRNQENYKNEEVKCSGAHQQEDIGPSWRKDFPEDIPFLRKLRIKDPISFSAVSSPAHSFRSLDPVDGNSGLRLLLSPLDTPRSIAASNKSVPLNKILTHSGLLRFESINNAGDDTTTSPQMSTRSSGNALDPEEIEGMGDSEESRSPLFDPSLLETFEKAVAASSDDTSWNSSSNMSNSSSSRIGGSSSSDTCSDADSLDWLKENNACQPIDTGNDKQILSSNNSLLQRDLWSKKDILGHFQLKCPPSSEDKVVLYLTSLRGIRKTYEECGMVKMILKGYGVHVFERDVWMHSKFRQELTHVMGAVLNVPRLFIRGRYIGGVEEVKHLHEQGILDCLLEGFQSEPNDVCGLCGDIKFIPCITCSGSRKMICFDGTSECPDCNENGLILCPSCDW
jgi:glutaredoxin domain-containing cysteine-rich protein 1